MNQAKIGILPFWLKLYDDSAPEARPRIEAFVRTIAAGVRAAGRGGRRGAGLPAREGVRGRGEALRARRGRRDRHPAPRLLAVARGLRRAGPHAPPDPRAGHHAHLRVRPGTGSGRDHAQPRHPRRAGHVQPARAQRQALRHRGRPLGEVRRDRPDRAAPPRRAHGRAHGAGSRGPDGHLVQGHGRLLHPAREAEGHRGRHGEDARRGDAEEAGRRGEARRRRGRAGRGPGPVRRGGGVGDGGRGAPAVGADGPRASGSGSSASASPRSRSTSST